MVKGTITDEHGDPLAGVSVIVKNTTRGVASDLDGNYSIQASSSETLEFSFLSMFTEERKIGNQSVINVIMREDRTNLQEVVDRIRPAEENPSYLRGYSLPQMPV